MDRSIRRALTVTGGAVTALALFTGTASAHYCYTTKGVDGHKANGQAWATAEETAAELAAATFLRPACREAVVAHVEQLGEDGALFMGPGLLAGGAAQQGQLPDGMGHLFQDAMAFPACAYLFEE